MNKLLYDVKAIIIDLDGVVENVKSRLEKYPTKKNFYPPINEIVVYPYGLDKSIWIHDLLDKVENFLSYLIALNIPVSIVSYGNAVYVKYLIKLCNSIDESDFTAVISNENLENSQYLEKNIIKSVQKMNTDLCSLAIIGSYYFHSKIKIINKILRLSFRSKNKTENLEPDFIVDDLSTVLSIIKKNIILKPGKLPNRLLAKFLSKYEFKDPALIIGPSIGEDTAAIDIKNKEILVIKSDPVTLTSDSISYYSVIVNSNDIATSGALPKWMLTTILFPKNISVYEVQKTFEELHDSCSNYNITICGGHTEITDSVSKPIIISSIMGTVERKNLINKKLVKRGDLVIMTKGTAMEGTAIIASEFEQLLLSKGMSAKDISISQNFKTCISILKEAKIAWQNDGVSALHDVTEGGIATALTELSEASCHGANIILDNIFVYDQTKKICDLFKINVLGLIGSGTLLICCRPNTLNSLLDQMQNINIKATIIGEITKKYDKIQAFKNGKLCQFPQFRTDEITHLFN